MKTPICSCLLLRLKFLTLSSFTIVLDLTMAKICTISDESDTSGDETVQVEANQGATESHSKHESSVQQTSRGEYVSRFGPVGNVQEHSPVSYSVSRMHKHKALRSLDKNMSSCE